MSAPTASLRRKIGSARALQSVVGAMKALAASNIGQYERSVSALAEYYRTVELGLGVCFREEPPSLGRPREQESGVAGVVVFGTDQGLVGRFNEAAAGAVTEFSGNRSTKPRVHAVGGRVGERLADAGLEPEACFPVPNSVKGIAPLVGRMLMDCGGFSELHLFHNRQTGGGVNEVAHQQLLPLDEVWRSGLRELSWPTKLPPQVMGGGHETLRALVGEFLFVSLFKACAESLAAENASRLLAMQRAERNINELLDDLQRNYRRIRQAGIDEELFDVVSGFEALKGA